MKMDAAKVKAIAGLFLEGLLLVLVFACSRSNFSFINADNQEEPSGKISTFHQVVLRTAWITESIFHTISRHTVASGEFIITLVSIPVLNLSFSDALLINTYERNSFYVLLRDNAP